MIAILANLSRNGRLPIFALLSLLAAFDLSLLFFRMKSVGNWGFAFLAWNLMLAFIPYGLGLLFHARRSRWSWKAAAPLLGLWLIFLPNAPYLLTDLAHMTRYGDMGIWYDLILLLSFAVTGLLLTMISLYDIHSWLRNQLRDIQAWLIVTAVCYGCGIGIYLGRFLRWNSWDLFTQPGRLLSEGGDHIMNSANPLLQFGFALLLGTFLLLLYSIGWYLFKVFARQELVAESAERMRFIY